MRSKACCLLFLLMSLLAYNKGLSQHMDYIVTLNNDTIYGHLDYRFHIATELITETKTYAIDERYIESYFSAERKNLFRRRILPGKKRYLFIACMETGRINLYVMTANIVNAYNPAKVTMTVYAEKEKDKLVEVWTNQGMFGNKNTKQKQAFKSLIEDNAAIKDELDKDTKYDMIDVQYYIHEYNKAIQNQ